MNDHLLYFNPVPVARSVLCAAVLQFCGLPYNESSTVVERDETGWHGHGNCFGTLLLAAREVGWTHAELNFDLPPEMFGGQPAAKTLLKIVKYNFLKVPLQSMRAADVLMLRYVDVDALKEEAHHVAICTRAKLPESPAPARLFHASQSAGRAYECDIDPLYMRRIESVLACKYLIDG